MNERMSEGLGDEEAGLPKTALYPGTFDPITNGHLDLIQRGRRLFDELIVGVAYNPTKKALFSKDERIEVIRTLLQGEEGVRVTCIRGLVVDFARRRGIRILLRGLRTISDFEFEFQMALTNRSMASEIETVFVMPSEEYAYTSSRFIKETVMMGGDVSRFVPPLVEEKLLRKFEDMRRSGELPPIR
jgi:pantetheine-phosphate adenylyltransferase